MSQEWVDQAKVECTSICEEIVDHTNGKEEEKIPVLMFIYHVLQIIQYYNS